MKSSATFWDKRSQHYDESAQKHGPVFEHRIKKVKPLLKATDVVLDLGCASGEISLELAPFVKQIHGVDLSSKMIELATNKAIERQVNNSFFNQVDVFDSRFEKQSFSAIMAFNVLHLVEDPSKVLNRLYELLAPGGYLISETPCLHDQGLISRSLITFAVKISLAPMIHNFRLAELESLISEQHFDLLESEIWDKKTSTQWILAKKPD